MKDICTGCLCTGRKLNFIGETEFYQIYSQILNEIPVHDLSQVCVRVCWECCALLHKFQLFKAQVKRSYTELLWNVPTESLPSRLSSSLVFNISYPDQVPIVKDRLEEVKDEYSNNFSYTFTTEDIKAEAEDDNAEHREPETFVNDLAVEKNETIDKSTKKSKKKPKEKKPGKNKTKVKNKRKTKLAIPPEQLLSDCISDRELDSNLLEDDFGDDVPDRAEEKKEESELTKLKVEVAVERIGTESNEVAKPVSNGQLTVVRVPKPPAELLPEKPQCVECGKIFSSRKTYRYHLNVLHKGNNRYPCPRCGKVYQWKSNLGRHMRTHKAVDAGELYCELCDKSFASVATYRQHLRISRRHVSENEFSFTCNECGKKFVNKTRLRDHIDWEHLKKIKFRCQLCNKPFKCHTSLYVHLQNVHRNKEKKDNLCHVCGKSYQNAAKLKYHIIALHTGETPYQCSQCSAAFGWYSSLYRHIREVHYKVKTQPKKTKKSKKLEEPPGYINFHP